MDDQKEKFQEEKHDQQKSFYNEKTEEKVEKEVEKFEEKHDRDPLSSLTWAVILIWAGFTFLASNLGLLDRLQMEQMLPEGFEFVGLSTWSVIFLGAGVIIFIEALIRTFVPAYRSTNGNFFLAAIFLGIGLSGIFGWDVVWPFILIALGISSLASALIKNRQ